MTRRFAGLKQLHDADPLKPDGDFDAPEDASSPSAPTPPTPTPRPWEEAGAPTEPVKALNGRVPRSVRLAFDRQLTDAMDTLRLDLTVDLAVEALARLVTEDDEVRERWLHKLWELKRRA